MMCPRVWRLILNSAGLGAKIFMGSLGMIAKLSDICFPCLAQISSSSSYSSLKIILKQLFISGSVNIAEYLPRRTEPSANNC